MGITFAGVQHVGERVRERRAFEGAGGVLVKANAVWL
jgi:hypothetical protein